MELQFLEIITRIGLAFILSVLFGFERQFRRKQVGFSTFSLVAVGACTLTILGLEMATSITGPLAIVGGIITGVGFLGAGALIRPADKKVFGFTTAASIWAFAAVGIVIGAGYYTTALVFYAIIMIVISIDIYFERIGFGNYARSIHVTVNNPKHFEKIRKVLPSKTREVSHDFNHEKKEYMILFLVNENKNIADKVHERLERIKEIKHFKID